MRAALSWTGVVSVTGLVVSSALAHQTHFPGVSSRDGRVLPTLHDSIAEILKNNTVPGYSVALVRLDTDHEAEFDAWGVSTEDGDKMTPETLVPIGSSTKAFTAAALALIIDDFAHGRNTTALPDGLDEFTWKTKVKDLLPDGEYVLYDKWASETASLHDILSHVSGLQRHELMYGRNDSIVDVLHRMRYLRPSFELREHWHYNNLQYNVGAHLIHRLTGSIAPVFVPSRIFAPLNMSSSTLDYNTALRSGRLSHAFDSTGRRVPNILGEGFVELGWGAGGMISSAVDLAQWLKFLLGGTAAGAMDGGEKDGGKILPWDVVKECWSPYALVPRPAPAPFANGTVTYGMGWFQGVYRGIEGVQHGGALPGVSASVAFFPGLKLGIAQLANADGKGLVNGEIMWKIVDAVLEHKGKKSSHDLERQNSSNESSPSSWTAETTDTAAFSTPPRTSISSSVNTTAATRPFLIQPRIDISAFAGTYADPGYGSFTLCAATSSSAFSSHCSSVLAAVRAMNDTRPDTLYAAWPRIVFSHFRLVRATEGADADAWGNNTFAVRPTQFYPDGYGRNTTAFETDTLADYESMQPAEGFGRMEFVLDEEETDGKVRVRGVGWFGTVDYGVTPNQDRPGRTVQQRADVWFEKVGDV